MAAKSPKTRTLTSHKWPWWLSALWIYSLVLTILIMLVALFVPTETTTSDSDNLLVFTIYFIPITTTLLATGYYNFRKN